LVILGYSYFTRKNPITVNTAIYPSEKSVEGMFDLGPLSFRDEGKADIRILAEVRNASQDKVIKYTPGRVWIEIDNQKFEMTKSFPMPTLAPNERSYLQLINFPRSLLKSEPKDKELILDYTILYGLSGMPSMKFGISEQARCYIKFDKVVTYSPPACRIENVRRVDFRLDVQIPIKKQ